MHHSALKRDPVCEMVVDANAYTHRHDGIAYVFCSKQCQQRFIETPLLYVGTAGKQSVKQQGLSVLKQRNIKLEYCLSHEQANQMLASINTLMGIRQVSIKNTVLSVEYDLLQTTEAQIEDVLMSMGVKLANHWTQKIRRAMTHILEENQCSALSANINTAKTCHKK